ncbi:MAG: SPASM domain-containing protein, partial [Acidobacteriota bacterium]
EAWLSEIKPSVFPGWDDASLISDEERRDLIRLQDERNAAGGMIVNYLAHFESGDHFGCNAGGKMIYVDAFGEVSPCVFIPLTFGNVRERSVKDITKTMAGLFQPRASCFMNTHYARMRKYAGGPLPIGGIDAIACAAEAAGPGPAPEFWRISHGR